MDSVTPLGRLRNFRSEQLQLGVNISSLSRLQLGLESLNDNVDGVCKIQGSDDLMETYSVVICTENMNYNLGSYVDKESAVLVHDCALFKLMPDSLDNNLTVLTPSDKPFLHLIKVRLSNQHQDSLAEAIISNLLSSSISTDFISTTDVNVENLLSMKINSVVDDLKSSFINIKSEYPRSSCAVEMAIDKSVNYESGATSVVSDETSSIESSMSPFEFNAAIFLSELSAGKRHNNGENKSNIKDMEIKKENTGIPNTSSSSSNNFFDDSPRKAASLLLSFPWELCTPLKIGGRPRSNSTSTVAMPDLPRAVGRPRAETICTSDTIAMEAIRTATEHVGNYTPTSRRRRIEKFLEKRKKRVWKKTVKYDVRKNFADSRIRIRGRFVRKEDELKAIAASTPNSTVSNQSASGSN